MSNPPVKPPKPTAAELEAAKDATIDDVIGPDLRVLFCGVNPGLYSGATGHHFARPGNRFWPALFAGGFTLRLLTPWEKDELLEYGLGLTNLVDRTTAQEKDLSKDELQAGVAALHQKIKRYRPRVLAVLGIGAYRTGFERRKARLGLQDELIDDTKIWVLPHPSGLNAHYTPQALAKLFAELKQALVTL